MVIKIFKAVYRGLYKTIVAHMLAIGGIFGNYPKTKNLPGSKEIGREKGD